MIVLTILPVLLAVLIFIFGFSWYLAHISLIPTRTPKTKTPQDYDLPFENFSVQSEGLTLKGWFVPNSKTAPTIILTHGWSRSAEQMLPHAEYLHQAGFSLVLYDLRGHGNSDSVEFTTINRMLADLDAVFGYALKRNDINSDSVGLFGHSMGGALSILKASRDNRVKTLVSSSAFADFSDLITQMLKMRGIPVFPFRMLVAKFWQRHAGVSLDAFNPLGQIGKIQIPILLIHGQRDQIIALEQLHKLHKNAKSAEKLVIERRGHSALYQDETYCKSIAEYFSRTLRSE